MIVPANPAQAPKAAAEAREFVITRCSFSTLMEDLRPDLGAGRIDREIRQTVRVDADGQLICERSLTHLPANSHFSDCRWDEGVPLRALDPERVVVVGDDFGGWRLDARTANDEDRVTDRTNGQTSPVLVIWSTDETAARLAAEALRLLIREARTRKPGPPGTEAEPTATPDPGGS
jgi:hypothetical protein